MRKEKLNEYKYFHLMLIMKFFLFYSITRNEFFFSCIIGECYTDVTRTIMATIISLTENELKISKRGKNSISFLTTLAIDH